LPFHLYTWGIGGQSVSPTEAAILLAAVLVGARLVGRRRDLTPQRPLRRGEGEHGTGAMGEGGAMGEAGAMREASAIHRTPTDIGVGAHFFAPAGGDVSSPSAPFDGPITLLLAGALLSLLATEYLRLSLRELRTLILEPI